MSLRDCYELMQAEWVKLYNVEVGDIMRVLRAVKDCELGYFGESADRKNRMVGKCYEVLRIDSNHIVLAHDYFPFFCLEFVKKAEPEIEINVKINGKISKLSDISKETLLNIRSQA